MPFLPKLAASLSHGSHSHSHSRQVPPQSPLNPSISHQPTTQNGTNNNDFSHAHHNSSSTSLNSHAVLNKHPFDLIIQIESPPIILYGTPADSTGSLISGQLSLKVTAQGFKDQKSTGPTPTSLTPQRPGSKRSLSSNAIPKALTATLSNLNITAGSSSDTNIPKIMQNVKDHLSVESVVLSIEQNIHYSKPFLPQTSNSIQNCSGCRHKTVELARWDIMAQPHLLPIGDHSYPFSHLLPGNLPPSTTLGSAALTTIKYQMYAIVKYYYNNHTHEAKVVLPLNISRSILKGPDRNSLRVFPPTNVTASAVLPNVVHPKSSFTLELKLNGVTDSDRRWRMRRMGWRIEESSKLKVHACEHHQTKLKIVTDHVKKTENKVQIKRTQQSGPTSQFLVTTYGANSLRSTASNPTGEPNPNEQDEEVSNEEQLAELHPSDHANHTQNGSAATATAEAAAPALQEEPALFGEEIRTVASGELKQGWKTDFSGNGKVELVVDISGFNLTSSATPHYTRASLSEAIDIPHTHPTVSTDVDDPVLGISCSHSLIVEIVVAEELLQSSTLSSSAASLSAVKSNTEQRLAEISPSFANHAAKQRASNQASPALTPSASNSSTINNNRPVDTMIGVPTGSARVLRMQFKLQMSERSGLGISWDDEVPPTYDDVKALSPPTYSAMGNPNQIIPPMELAPVHIHNSQAMGRAGDIDSGLANVFSLGTGAISPVTTHINSPYGQSTTPGNLFSLSPSYSPRASSQLSQDNNIDELMLSGRQNINRSER
ncbi:hypothetical protein WICPIJ_002498 [Wickerhamomyces pijperi]|uniref:LDB19 N-terminal domain-containing protein n=1 Tax=Wickerhamomyces pijperi TaxID=599730 RepID=A0A9P8QBC5_WICPI|nr:hypothetical protein WICPIJ_002498 [Wickerhamomyces pijperi]